MDDLDDIFDDAPIENVEQNQNNINIPEENTTDDIFNEDILGSTTDKSLLDTFLKNKGITNSMITIVDENDEQKEVNFYDLTKEEQLDILNSSSEETNENLDDTEIELINHLRSNNLSVDDFLAQYKESILAEARTSVEQTYDIDAYDDQELFLLDLKTKYDLTDEELQIELEKELKNEDLFTKKITKIRSEYKTLEDQYKASQQAEFEAQQQEQYKTFASAMNTIAVETLDFHGISLEDSEKTETLSYLLDLDDQGMSKFSRDLNDPKKLYEAAWYLRYGKEAFQTLEDAYEAEITKLKKIDKPRAVVRNSKSNIKTIDDLFN